MSTLRIRKIEKDAVYFCTLTVHGWYYFLIGTIVLRFWLRILLFAKNKRDCKFLHLFLC